MQVPLLGGGQPQCNKMGIGIAAEKKYLEKQKTSGPNRRRTSEPGKEIFSNQQLNLKEKESANEDGYSDSVRVRENSGFLMLGWAHKAVFWDHHVGRCVMNLIRQLNPAHKASSRRRSVNLMRFAP
jgi:hypothetical protein